MVSSILPMNERFQYIKLSQRSFFGRIEDTIICFRDLLTFSRKKIFAESYLKTALYAQLKFAHINFSTSIIFLGS